MTQTIEKQLNHRSIREFEDRGVSSEDLELFKRVIQRTATSTGIQSYSVIRVRDEEKRRAISEVCNQDYVRRAPELFIFIVDCYRNEKIAKELTGENLEQAYDMEKFFQGFSDSILAAQNLMTAIESKEMGGVFLGSILNDSQRIVEILNLPKYTFPSLGVAFGYPNQSPMLKPRMDMKLRFFEDEYQTFDNYLDEIKDYDEEMKRYYDLRQADKPLDSFSEQVVSRFKNTLEKRASMLNVVRSQGFDLKLRD
ncbi:nitroreductase family protein [Lagierella sp.]|uniref:nitroreductase family protein n=1 Tax=Lagierella sp. TaxID=2849657 RepID=UPI002627B187|nr:nitroreductase family protein [Lagierella sp.]